MSIPLHTTTITVQRRVGGDGDAYDKAESPESYVNVATKVRAVLSGPSASTQRAGGIRNELTWSLLCDPVEVDYLHRVVDEVTGRTYAVDWAELRTDPPDAANLGDPLEHVAGAISLVRGQT